MRLEIAANTGHHFFFIPITVDSNNPNMLERAIDHIKKTDPNDERLQWLQLGENDEKLSSELYRLGQGELFPWKEYSVEEEGGPGKEWIRYRLGRQERFNKQLPALLGVWLAIESNIGDLDRGFVEENITPTQREQEAIDGIRNPQTPYCFGKQEFAGHKAQTEVSNDFQDDFKEILKRIVSPGPGEEAVELEFGELPPLEIVWNPTIGFNIDVDLIIDLGNTRSAVISMITNAQGPAAKHDLFRALTFVNENESYWDKKVEADGLVDSFFVLQEPMFHDMHKTLTKYTIEERDVVTHHIIPPFTRHHTERVLTNIKKIRPQMFVQDAVATVGPEIQKLLSVPLHVQQIVKGGSYFQSSPKRYYWNTDEVGHGGVAWWNMFPRTWKTQKGFVGLQGELLSFCPIDGSDWSSDNPPFNWEGQQRPDASPAKAKYPRCTTMMWMAYSILEAAYRQLNSPVFNANCQPYIKRNFRGIYLTYPSGWTKEEIDSFKAKWETARNIFYWTHMEDSVGRSKVSPDMIKPIVKMEVDEAVAAQLPYVYSEIKKLEDVQGIKASVLWMKMIGSKNPNDGSPVARIMTLDIGGGTSDVSILEYQELNPSLQTPGKQIKASLLFKDSESTAGDLLVKKLIEKVLLPELTCNQDGNILTRWSGRTGAAYVNKKQLVIRQVLIPIVRFWMQCVSEGKDFKNNEGFCYSANDMRIDQNNYDDLKWIFNNDIAEGTPSIDILDMSESIEISLEQFEQCVLEVFGGGGFMERMSQIVSAFHVDAVVVCGKVSELPVLKKLIYRFMPLSGNRIIFMKDYPIGEWYPSVFSENGKIKDPKTATVSGAALHHAFSCGAIHGWQLQYDNSNFVQQNYWKIDGKGMPFFTRNSDDRQTTINTPVNTGDIFCRSIFAGSFSSEPVYMLRMKDPLKRGTQSGNGDTQLENSGGTGVLNSLTLSRCLEEGVEKLKIDKADGVFTDAAGHQTIISEEDVELYLHPMRDDENWQDSTILGE